jgi:hypothetical protein
MQIDIYATKTIQDTKCWCTNLIEAAHLEQQDAVEMLDLLAQALSVGLLQVSLC